MYILKPFVSIPDCEVLKIKRVVKSLVEKCMWTLCLRQHECDCKSVLCLQRRAEMASVESFCAFCCILNSQTVSCLSFSVVSKKVVYFFMHRQFEIGSFKIV